MNPSWPPCSWTSPALVWLLHHLPSRVQGCDRDSLRLPCLAPQICV